MVTSGRCPILKNLSVGGWSHPRLWIVWWKKKRFYQKICVPGDGQACVRAESQIEVDAHPRSVTCTHTHTQNPLTVPGYCLRPTRHQPNETYLWQEHAAPALLHTGTSWILAADTHTRTYSHSGRREADGKMKTGRKDAVVSFSPLPHWVLSHLVTRRLALCPMLRPRSPHSSSFSYPAANTSLVLRLSFFLNPRETVLHFCLSVFKLFLSQTPGSPSFFPQHAPQFHPPWLNPALSPRAPFTSDFDRPYFVAGTVKRTLWDWVEVAQTHTHWHLVVTQHSWSWDFHVLQEMSSLDSKWFVLQRIPALNFLEIAVVSHKYLHQGCI